MRLSNLSAITPPTRPTVMSGSARNTFTRPMAVADSVSCHVSQLRATWSAHIADDCPMSPNHNSRKLRFSSEANGIRNFCSQALLGADSTRPGEGDGGSSFRWSVFANDGVSYRVDANPVCQRQFMSSGEACQANRQILEASKLRRPANFWALPSVTTIDWLTGRK